MKKCDGVALQSMPTRWFAALRWQQGLAIFVTGYLILVAAVISVLFFGGQTKRGPSKRSEVRYLSLDRTRNRPIDTDSINSARIPDFLKAEVTGLAEGEYSVPEWSRKLHQLGHRVCCESIREPRLNPYPRRFAISTEPRPLAVILEELTLWDERYRWEWMVGRELVNIVPVRSSLDVALEHVSFVDRQLNDCVDDLYPKCGIGYPEVLRYRVAGNLGCWPFRISATNITCRDYLNLLAVQYDGLAWHISDKGSTTFDVHPRERFHQIAEQFRREARERQKIDEAVLERELNGRDESSQ